MSGIVTEETFGRPTAGDILRKYNMKPIAVARLRGSELCKLNDGMEALIQYGKKYKLLGPRQDVNGPDDRRPTVIADWYLYADTASPKNVRIIGRVYSKLEILQKCRDEILSYDQANNKHYVTWSELND
jgi:hypothetical protein